MFKFVKTYFWEVIKYHYIDFEGCASRKQYLYFVIVLEIICSSCHFEPIIRSLIHWITMLPIYAIEVRRLHDANMRGWWLLLIYMIAWCRPLNDIQILPSMSLGNVVGMTILLLLPSIKPNRFDRNEDTRPESFVKTYFWEVIKYHYMDFEGRASRKQYLYFGLIYQVIFNYSFSVLNSLTLPTSSVFLPLLLIANILLILPALAISVRRLHDGNYKGWWFLPAAITGIIFLLRYIFLLGSIENLHIAKWFTSVLYTPLNFSLFLVFIILLILPSSNSNKFDKKENTKSEKTDELAGSVQ